MIDHWRRNKILYANFLKLNFAFCRVKRRHRVNYENAVVQPLSSARSIISAACISVMTVTFWIKFLTEKFANSMFYYSCLQNKQLRANKTIFCVFLFILGWYSGIINCMWWTISTLSVAHYFSNVDYQKLQTCIWIWWSYYLEHS